MKGHAVPYRSVLVLIGGFMAWGCTSWSLRPARDRSPRSPHEVAARRADSPRSATVNRAAGPGGPSDVVNLAFDLLRTELPVESIRHSKKVWNHVDELRIDSALSGRLARNGLRIGAASVDAWPAIRTILDSCGARAHREQLLPQTGLPVVVELGTIESSESIFCYAPDGRLVGQTFPAGGKLITFGYRVHPELGGYVDLKVSLEVRHDRGVMTWERRDGIIRQVPALDRRVFEDLSVLLSLKAGEFLVIGPSKEADNEYLLGSRFFMRQRGDIRYEVLLLVTPSPYRTRTAESGVWQNFGND